MTSIYTAAPRGNRSSDPRPHDPLLCGLDAADGRPLCHACRAAEARHAERQECERQRYEARHLAEVLRAHPDLFRPVLLDLLADDIVDLCAVVALEATRGQ